MRALLRRRSSTRISTCSTRSASTSTRGGSHVATPRSGDRRTISSGPAGGPDQVWCSTVLSRRSRISTSSATRRSDAESASSYRPRRPRRVDRQQRPRRPAGPRNGEQLRAVPAVAQDEHLGSRERDMGRRGIVEHADRCAGRGRSQGERAQDRAGENPEHRRHRSPRFCYPARRDPRRPSHALGGARRVRRRRRLPACIGHDTSGAPRRIAPAFAGRRHPGGARRRRRSGASLSRRASLALALLAPLRQARAVATAPTPVPRFSSMWSHQVIVS